MEVQNLGVYPITIEEVGLLVGKTKGDLPKRAPFPPHQVLVGPQLPHRLDRHDAISITVPITSLPDEDFSAAYARTAAGRLVQGTSAALDDIIDVITTARRRREQH